VKVIIAPGFSPSDQALTASLMRLDLVAILIFSISGLVMAGLHANQHFLLPPGTAFLQRRPIVWRRSSVLRGRRMSAVSITRIRLGLYGRSAA
jgi:putative peptidoglycan lipid II flippase